MTLKFEKDNRRIHEVSYRQQTFHRSICEVTDIKPHELHQVPLTVEEALLLKEQFELPFWRKNCNGLHKTALERQATLKMAYLFLLLDLNQIHVLKVCMGKGQSVTWKTNS